MAQKPVILHWHDGTASGVSNQLLFAMHPSDSSMCWQWSKTRNRFNQLKWFSLAQNNRKTLIKEKKRTKRKLYKKICKGKKKLGFIFLSSFSIFLLFPFSGMIVHIKAVMGEKDEALTMSIFQVVEICSGHSRGCVEEMCGPGKANISRGFLREQRVAGGKKDEGFAAAAFAKKSSCSSTRFFPPPLFFSEKFLKTLLSSSFNRSVWEK